MLGKPENGWALFQLGSEDTAYDLSYLTDVALEWLSQAIHGLETLDVFSVHGYCEPGRMVCTVSYWSCYVIFEDDGPAPACQDVRHLHVNMLDFCRQLHQDIARYLDDWVHWDENEAEAGAEDESEEAIRRAYQRRRDLLTQRLDALRRLIDQRAEDFGPDRCFL